MFDDSNLSYEYKKIINKIQNIKNKNYMNLFKLIIKLIFHILIIMEFF